jgi:hypothetical protein
MRRRQQSCLAVILATLIKQGFNIQLKIFSAVSAVEDIPPRQKTLEIEAEAESRGRLAWNAVNFPER